jgi:hypothetical protein
MTAAINSGISGPHPLMAEIHQTTIYEIRFARQTAPGDSILLRFSQPCETLAIAERIDEALLFAKAAQPAKTDRCHIVVLGNDAPFELRKTFETWIGTSIPTKIADTTIRWSAERVLILGDAAIAQQYLEPIARFAFLEREFRRLEEKLLPIEAHATADVPIAYEIQRSHRTHWKRLARTMEQLYEMRLKFARLEPQLSGLASPGPSSQARLWRRLLSRTRASRRLEAFSNRLEACEDLYEGATDRISDFRSYRRSEWLEAAILILLALEVLFTAWGVYLH